mmetsp:Transcript_7095/g.10156  ORF Transcript_7095/g.10156 Transcript_7095/m.10156 type:complete len:260 (+) Transcript_7095:102-881(+)
MTPNRNYQRGFDVGRKCLFTITFLSCAFSAKSFITSAVNVKIIRDHVHCTTGEHQAARTFELHMSIEDEARKLREEAKKLREEISGFQKEKDDVIKEAQEAERQVLADKQEMRMRYSAEVPILKGDGNTVLERCDFAPRFPRETSTIETFNANLPLGIILGEDEEIPGTIRVDEVVEDGNGFLAGVREGDLLRACTATQVTMETPTWQLMAGGIGQPKTKRFMYSVDGRPFEEVMDAVASNRMDPDERPIVLVIERRDA